MKTKNNTKQIKGQSNARKAMQSKTDAKQKQSKAKTKTSAKRNQNQIKMKHAKQTMHLGGRRQYKFNGT